MTNQASPIAGFLRPLHSRDPDEHHRVATSLELLFDLVSVIAIASAAAGLHHAIAENHAAQGVITFAMAFFAIWWAWMNFTWFASAYDNDDVVYRLLTMVIMGGSLTMAAGIPALFTEEPDFTMVIFGYVIMRIAMIVLWLRAAYHDPNRRRTALAYAAGIFIAQLYWVAFLAVQPVSTGTAYAMFVIGAILEIAVPAIAEPLSANTPWHRHHIIERYGLLNIIVLGETLLSGSMALRQVAGHFDIMLVHTALSALVIVFALWWAYFARQEHLGSRKLSRSLLWGYGHFFIFASGAAVGAGFAALVDIITHHSEVPLLVGDYAVAIPVAIYYASLWFVRDRFACNGFSRYALLIFGLLGLVAPAIGLGLEGIAATTALGVIVRNSLAAHEESGDHIGH
ncbi:low temperature requirement protein A [Neorhizobium petrolearium]|uniref:Low temperature requirement protein A n=1 Tax=Neorhizobium petrolearium TaxID=515361 RepID=A0ABY8LW36_9HYPH|nr:low temperature requirement protein A [Neorhizobium petrolearium]MCC2611343.1 low temperature requirement protein A [Neorhizobium petrolearium]WGI66541.1 low temperature requirement protein A [Neorhizobium petrolearium]